MDGHFFGFLQKKKLKKQLKKSQDSLENDIYISLVILINAFQLIVVILIGLFFNCLLEITILSFVFWCLRGVLKTKHFNPLLCTGITFLFYIVASILIKKLYLISFMPILLALALIIIMKKE